MAGKKYTQASEKIEDKAYGINEAVETLVSTATAKFDESIDLSARLGVDPRHADQMVRGLVVLPHGTGKKIRIVVFAKGEKQAEGRDAGADEVGAEDLVEKIKGGWLDFDKAVATPDIMGEVGKIGKILGPRGLMPNPKLGTVTFDVKKAVEDLKSGKIDYRVDKAGNVHTSLGKASFGVDKIKENLMVLLESIIKAKPPASKGTYLKSVFLSTTMGPSVRLDTVEVRNTFK